MYSVPVIVLLLVEFCLSFPAVVGDCYDDLPNNGSYDNCNTCYQTLANALIDTGDNKYYLAKTFFPDDAATPVQVTVEYLCISASDTADTNCTIINNGTNCTDATWYWLRGEFFVYQPLEIFMYRSLLFSPPHWRQTSLQLYLPHQCFICSNTSANFFEYLTQRLKLYASSQSTTAEVSSTYMGRAINASHSKLGDDALVGDMAHGIIQAVYIVPFITVFILLLVIIIIVTLVHCCACEHEGEENQETLWNAFLWKTKATLRKMKATLKKVKGKVTNDIQVQANLAALTVLCCAFTTYAFVLDIMSVVVENNANLPQYYHRKSYGFFVITIIFSLISFFICCFIGIVGLIVVWFYNAFFSCCKKCCKCCKKKWEVYIPMLFCIASAILSLSFHFQNVLIAWSTDPFYASRIALFYGIIIFSYFTSLKYAYSFPLKLLRRNEDTQSNKTKNSSGDVQFSVNSQNSNEDAQNNSDHWNTCELISVVASFIVTLVICSGIIVPVVLFIIHVPINNSIENSLTGITTIFNGAVILIGGYIAYRVGIKQFGNPFSMEDALKNAMGEINTTPFNNGNWDKLTEEGRLTEVMKGLISHQMLSRPRYSSLYSALTSVLIRAEGNGKRISPPADQVFTLSTILCDAIDTDVRTAAGNNNTETLIGKLVEVMSQPDFILDGPHIDLSKTPTRKMLDVLQRDLKGHINTTNLTVDKGGIKMDLTIALFAPLPSVLATVLRNAKNSGNPISPSADRVFTLSTVLYNAVNSAVRTAAGNDVMKINTLTNALIQVMNKPDFVLDGPHIDLAKTPTRKMLVVLQSDLQSHINLANLTVDEGGIKMDLTIALFAPLPSVLATVLRKAKNNGQQINPPDDGVVTVSTVLYNTINSAVRTVAENNPATNITTMTDGLIDGMTTPAVIVLDGPTIAMDTPPPAKLTTLRDAVQIKLKAAIVNNPANLGPIDIKEALQDVLTP